MEFRVRGHGAGDAEHLWITSVAADRGVEETGGYLIERKISVCTAPVAHTTTRAISY